MFQYPYMYCVWVMKHHVLGFCFCATNKMMAHIDPTIVNKCLSCGCHNETVHHVLRCSDIHRSQMFNESADKLCTWHFPRVGVGSNTMYKIHSKSTILGRNYEGINTKHYDLLKNENLRKIDNGKTPLCGRPPWHTLHCMHLFIYHSSICLRQNTQ